MAHGKRPLKLTIGDNGVGTDDDDEDDGLTELCMVLEEGHDLPNPKRAAVTQEETGGGAAAAAAPEPPTTEGGGAGGGDALQAKLKAWLDALSPALRADWQEVCEHVQQHGPMFNFNRFNPAGDPDHTKRLVIECKLRHILFTEFCRKGHSLGAVVQSLAGLDKLCFSPPHSATSWWESEAQYHTWIDRYAEPLNWEEAFMSAGVPKFAVRYNEFERLAQTATDWQDDKAFVMHRHNLLDGLRSSLPALMPVYTYIMYHTKSAGNMFMLSMVGCNMGIRHECLLLNFKIHSIFTTPVSDAAVEKAKQTWETTMRTLGATEYATWQTILARIRTTSSDLSKCSTRVFFSLRRLVFMAQRKELESTVYPLQFMHWFMQHTSLFFLAPDVPVDPKARQRMAAKLAGMLLRVDVYDGDVYKIPDLESMYNRAAAYHNPSDRDATLLFHRLEEFYGSPFALVFMSYTFERPVNTGPETWTICPASKRFRFDRKSRLAHILEDWLGNSEKVQNMRKRFKLLQDKYYAVISIAAPVGDEQRALVEKILVELFLVLHHHRSRFTDLVGPDGMANFYKWAMLDDVDRIFRVQPEEHDKRAKLMQALVMIRPPESWDQIMTTLSIYPQWMYIKQVYATHGPRWFSSGHGAQSQQRFVKLLSMVLAHKFIMYSGQAMIDKYLRPHLVALFDARMEFTDDKAWATWLDWCLAAAKAVAPPQPP